MLEALETATEGLSITRCSPGQHQLWTGREGIQLLSLESPSPIVKQGSKWKLTAAEFSEKFW